MRAIWPRKTSMHTFGYYNHLATYHGGRMTETGSLLKGVNLASESKHHR